SGQAWARFEVEHHRASITGIRRSRSRASIFVARQLSSVLARGHRHRRSKSAERLYAASMVTAEATVRALLSGSPDHVALVAMGDNGIKRTGGRVMRHSSSQPPGRQTG